MLRKTGYFLLFLLPIGVALFSVRYWSFDKVGFLNLKGEATLANVLWRAGFYGHVIFGPLALAIGPFQFLPKFRQRRLRLHRNLGKIYVVACLLSGLAGLTAAQFTPGGALTVLGFSLLAVGWLYTTSQAWLTIRRGRVEAHRRWMLRSYALTLSAVTLRLWLPLLEGPAELTFLESYRIVAWVSWVPNILVVEYFIRRRPALAVSGS